MLIELANKLRCSMHRRCLRYYYSFVFNNPPFSPFLRVTLLQTLNISGKPYHSKILKTHVYYQSYQQHVHYGSVALCAFGTSVRLSAFTSVFSPSLCALLYVVGLLNHSIFQKNPTYAHHAPFVLPASYHLAYGGFLFF